MGETVSRSLAMMLSKSSFEFSCIVDRLLMMIMMMIELRLLMMIMMIEPRLLGMIK